MAALRELTLSLQVDLAKAQELGMPVVRVPAYSPEAGECIPR